jgi:hypothetical protein
MTIQDREESIQKRIVVEQSTVEVENIDLVILTKQLRSVSMRAPPKYSKCGLLEHNARTCSL